MTDQGGQTPPGWYQAAGDPPGTQRYWDGSQWQGGPQPVGGATPGGAQSAFSGAGDAAELGQRLIAYLIDAGLMVGIYIAGIILVAIFGAIADFLGAIMVLVWLVAIFGFAIYNILYLQGTTGQTIGKKQQGIKLLDNKTGQPVGIGMAFVRNLLGGFLGGLCLLDYLWLFKDNARLRLSDQILDYQVRKV